jgi:hypothetical protein
MPKKNNNLKQYVKGLDEYKDRILSINDGLKINPDSLQLSMDEEKKYLRKQIKEKITKNRERYL